VDQTRIVINSGNVGRRQFATTRNCPWPQTGQSRAWHVGDSAVARQTRDSSNYGTLALFDGRLRRGHVRGGAKCGNTHGRRTTSNPTPSLCHLRGDILRGSDSELLHRWAKSSDRGLRHRDGSSRSDLIRKQGFRERAIELTGQEGRRFVHRPISATTQPSMAKLSMTPGPVGGFNIRSRVSGGTRHQIRDSMEDSISRQALAFSVSAFGALLKSIRTTACHRISQSADPPRAAFPASLAWDRSSVGTIPLTFPFFVP